MRSLLTSGQWVDGSVWFPLVQHPEDQVQACATCANPDLENSQAALVMFKMRREQRAVLLRVHMQLSYKPVAYSKTPKSLLYDS